MKTTIYVALIISVLTSVILLLISPSIDFLSYIYIGNIPNNNEVIYMYWFLQAAPIIFLINGNVKAEYDSYGYLIIFNSKSRIKFYNKLYLQRCKTAYTYIFCLSFFQVLILFSHISTFDILNFSICIVGFIFLSHILISIDLILSVWTRENISLLTNLGIIAILSNFSTSVFYSEKFDFLTYIIPTNLMMSSKNGTLEYYKNGVSTNYIMFSTLVLTILVYYIMNLVLRKKELI